MLVPKLQITKPQTNVPYCAAPVEPLPSTSTTTHYKSEPISLEIFNHAATDLNEKGVINVKKYKNTFIKSHIKMNPHQFIVLTGPTNNFTMGGIPMHFANILIAEQKPIPQVLFLDIMVEKTQLLIEHINNHHLGLCLTANIGNNTAIIQLYDNFATIDSQVLQVTISNLPDLEMQLFQLYVEVTRVIHTFMPEEDDEMPPLEDISNDEL